MKFASAFLSLLAGATTTSAQTILDTVVASADHATLEAAVLAAPSVIAETLGDENLGLTLFAPDDTAFTNLAAAVGQDYIDDLLTEPWASHLVCLLTSHVLDSVVNSTTLTGSVDVATLSGYEIEVDRADGVVTVEGIVVTTPDIGASNGIIHSITSLPVLPPCVSESIYDQGSDSANFSTVVSLIERADLEEALNNTRPLTLFAPSNDAFSNVPQYILDYLLSNVTALTEVLTYHVAPEIILLDTSVAGDFETLQGDTLSITSTDELVKVNDADVTNLNILASNGVIFTISAVLIPPTMSLPADPSLTGAPATEMPITTPPITTSPATELPATIAPNTMAPIVSPVVAPATELPDTTAPNTMAPVAIPIDPVTIAPVSSPVSSILDIVAGSEVHTTLEAAVLGAPAFIAETLGDPTQTLTLFAPDDAAFTNLIGAAGEDSINALLTEPWAAHLSCFLASHVLGSVVMSGDITGTSSVATLSGYEVEVVAADGTVTVDGIEVTGADVLASNGVVHVISAFPILPPCVSASIYVQGNVTDDFSTVISLVNKVGLVDALSNTLPLTLFAPTNAAFAKVPQSILDYLLANDTALTEVLLYHVVPSNLILDSGAGVGTYSTLQGDDVTVRMADDMTFTVNGMAINTTNVLASNGVIQIVSDVLIPPSLAFPVVPTAAPTPAPTEEAPSSSSTPSAVLACAMIGLLTFAVF